MQGFVWPLRRIAAATALGAFTAPIAVAQGECALSDEDLRNLTGMYVAGVAGFSTAMTEGARPQALGFLISRALSAAPEGSDTRACVKRMDAVLQSAFEKEGAAPFNGYVAGSMGVPPAEDPFRGQDPAELIALIEDMEASDADADAEAIIATEWECVDLTFFADGKSYPAEVWPGALRLSLGDDGSLYRSMASEKGSEPVLTSGTWEMSGSADQVTVNLEGENPDVMEIETLTRDRLVLSNESEAGTVTRFVFERIPDD